MKISLDSAMRARDVSQPRAVHEAAAERAEAAMIASKPRPGARPAFSGQEAATTAHQESTQADEPRAESPATTNREPERRASAGRARRRRRHSAPPRP